MKAKRILMVDDDRDLVASVKAFLEARGYDVDTAHSGIEARERLAQRRPDLVVLDIMMDYDTDGFNVAYKLRDEPETEAHPGHHHERFHQGARDQDAHLRADDVPRMAGRQVLREAGQARRPRRLDRRAAAPPTRLPVAEKA